ncbi:MAG: ABC transporter permease, partial [Acidimicrobiia bacterium]|nr:ABC transporter permease [Acidimicrobiia bacterium]
GVTGLEETAARALADDGALDVVPVDTVGDLTAIIDDRLQAWRTPDDSVVVALEPPSGASKVDVTMGISFPPDFFTDPTVASVEVLVSGAVPPEVRTALAGVVREMAHAVAGSPLPVSAPEALFTVLGEDRAGDQVSVREQLRPLFVFLVLLMEMFAMSALIAREIADRTVHAILVTPARISDVLAAKGIAGTVSGFGQAVLLLVAIRSLGPSPLLTAAFVAVGALMVSGTAMIAGSAGKDFVGTLFYGMIFMIPLMIPAFSALFPGTASPWIRALPSYPLIRGLVDVITLEAGWADVAGKLGAVGAWCLALFSAGWIVLKRKVEAT